MESFGSNKPAPRRKKLVLVADDLESTREFMGFILKDHGYDVVTAKDGKAAVALAAEKQPDVVLLDILMPGMDGFSACAEIRGNPACAHTKIIMFSALNSDADKTKADASGADAYLEKPVETDKLLAALKEVLS